MQDQHLQDQVVESQDLRDTNAEVKKLVGL